MVMANNHSWEEQTRRYLAEAQTDLKKIEKQIAELHEKSIALTREVNAYETALKSYLIRTGRLDLVEFDWAKILRNAKTHKDQLKTMAKYNNSNIKVAQATDILYTNKFIKSRKRSTAYSMVQSLLADMAEDGIFRKVNSGEYQYVGNQ